MIVAIRDNLSDHASFNDGKGGDDEDDEEPGQGKMSEDDEPHWVIGTVTKTVLRCKNRFRQPL
jgi:hypothetical protein